MIKELVVCVSVILLFAMIVSSQTIRNYEHFQAEFDGTDKTIGLTLLGSPGSVGCTNPNYRKGVITAVRYSETRQVTVGIYYCGNRGQYKTLYSIIDNLTTRQTQVAALAQTSRPNSMAEKGWSVFWEKFTAAVKNKNKVALSKLMDPDFFGGVGSPSKSDWLKLLDNFWKGLQESVSTGTVSSYSYGRGNATGMYKYKSRRLSRDTKDNNLHFEFYNNRWWFVSVASND